MKTGKPATEADPAVKRCIDAFHDACVRRFGFKPDPRQYGRLGRDLKPLLATWGEADMLSLIDEFFTTSEPRITRSDYSVAAFLAVVQLLKVRRLQAPDARTAENIDAAVRATRRRGGP